MAAAAPDSVMPVTLTALPVPTFLLAKLAAPLTVSASPAKRLSASVTVALAVPSYTRFWPMAVTVSARGVMVSAPLFSTRV